MTDAKNAPLDDAPGWRRGRGARDALPRRREQVAVPRRHRARGPEPPWVGAGGGEVSLVPKGVPVPGRRWGHPGGRQTAWVWISGQGGRGDSGVAHVERAA